MRHITATVQGRPIDIRIPEDGADEEEFLDWLARHARAWVGLDTETTGLGIWGSEFRVRTVQFGTKLDAWVLLVDRSRATIMTALAAHQRYALHNAPFDLLAMDREGLADIGDMLPKAVDTYILAHLLDPRGPGEDGAPGLSMKALAEVYVDEDASDGQKDLIAWGRSVKRTKATMWSHPDIIDSDVYLMYAGLDVVYTSHLLEQLGSQVRHLGLSRLAEWEHGIQTLTTRMTHRGILVDQEYAHRLDDDLVREAEEYAAIAKEYGVANVNSTRQIRDALLDMGVELVKRTETGNLSVAADVLLPLAGLSPYWTEIEGADVNPLAEAVVKSKRAAKWRTAYVEPFIRDVDASGRLHPFISSLAARTARMSISRPPLQQLPAGGAGGWRIRRAIVADEGHVFVSSDFSQIELRVIAANAGVKDMIYAIEHGIDLHDRTANLIWGEGQWTKKQRGIAKNVAFGRAYGAGPRKIAQTAGIPYPEAKAVYDAYSSAYPELDPYSDRLQRDAGRHNWTIVTSFGRRLPLSRERSYAALNYDTQSTARDLFAKALTDMDRAGLGESMVLPVHDEIITSFPIDEAEERAREVARLMTSTYKGIPIDADSEVCWGGSWGSHPDFKIPPAEDYRPDEHARKG